MRTTVVPAQVTTVEDKIAGNLSFTQLLLLTVPVFIDGAIFVILPPLFRFSNLKLVVSIVVAFICLVLAIRIKGKIIAQWLGIIVRYRLRPAYYLFDKNDAYLRESRVVNTLTLEPIPTKSSTYSKPILSLISDGHKSRLENAIADPRANFHVRAEKGGLRVYIREIKEEVV